MLHVAGCVMKSVRAVQCKNRKTYVSSSQEKRRTNLKSRSTSTSSNVLTGKNSSRCYRGTGPARHKFVGREICSRYSGAEGTRSRNLP